MNNATRHHCSAACLRSHARLRPPMAEPVRESYWRDALEALAGIPIFLALFIGLPLLLWLIAGGGS